MPVVTQEEVKARMAAGLAAALGGSVQNELKVAVERAGLAFEVKPFEGRHGRQVATIAVSLASPAGAAGACRSDGRARVAGRPTILLRARNTVDAAGERLGLDSPVVVDETLFARAVAVEGAAPHEVVRAALSAPAARAAVLQLLQTVPEVKLDAVRGRVELCVGCAPSGSLHEHIEPLLPLLATLSSALPIFEDGPKWGEERVVDRLGPLVGFVSLVGGLVLVFFGMSSFEPEQHSALGLGFGLGLPIAALLGVGVFLLSRGRPGGLRTVLLTVIPLSLGIPAVIGGGALVLNGKLDRSQAAFRHVRIVRKEVRSSKNGTRRLLHLEHRRADRPWPGPLEVSEAEYLAASEERRVVLRVRGGRLGWPWLEGWSLE